MTLARPTIEIPDETKRTIWQLREKRKTLDQISRQTGLRYNVVQRFLANSDPRTRFASNPGTHVSVSDDPAVNRQSSEIIGPRLNSAPKFSSNPSPPSASQQRH